MTSDDHSSSDLKLANQATLDLFSALERGASVTQRSLAAQIGIALGLTNSLIKRSIHKGLIKVGQAPAKRYSYYVTPKGFSEKSRLVAEYLTSSLSFFRQAKQEYSEIFDRLKVRGCERIALCGAGELAEIAILAAHEHNVEIYCILDQDYSSAYYCNYRIFNDVYALQGEKIDAFVITSSEAPQDVYDELRKNMSLKSIHTVSLLRISLNNGAGSGHE